MRPKVLEKHWLLTFQTRLHKDIEHILWHFLEPFNYLFVKLHTFVIAFPFSSRHIYQIFIQIQTDFSFLFLNTGFSRLTRILWFSAWMRANPQLSIVFCCYNCLDLPWEMFFQVWVTFFPVLESRNVVAFLRHYSCLRELGKQVKGIQDIRTLFDNCDHNNQFRSNRKSGPWFLSIEEIMAVLNTRIRKCLTF